MGKVSDSAPTVVLNRAGTDPWSNFDKAVVPSSSFPTTTTDRVLTRAESKLPQTGKKPELLNDKEFLKDLLSICKRVFDEHGKSVPNKHILPKVLATDASTKAVELKNRVNAGSMGQGIQSELKQVAQYGIIAAGQLLEHSEIGTNRAILEVGELASRFMSRTLSSIATYTAAQKNEARVEEKGATVLRLSGFLRKALNAIS